MDFRECLFPLWKQLKTVKTLMNRLRFKLKWTQASNKRAQICQNRVLLFCPYFQFVLKQTVTKRSLVVINIEVFKVESCFGSILQYRRGTLFTYVTVLCLTLWRCNMPWVKITRFQYHKVTLPSILYPFWIASFRTFHYSYNQVTIVGQLLDELRCFTNITVTAVVH